LAEVEVAETDLNNVADVLILVEPTEVVFSGKTKQLIAFTGTSHLNALFAATIPYKIRNRVFSCVLELVQNMLLNVVS